MAFPAIKPIYTYTDIDGRPLDDGYLYYGVANLDPEANPITVYWDAAETQPATQPIRTIGGYAVNAGVRAIVYAPSDYSVNVRNKNGSLVSTSPSELNDNPFTFIQSGAGAVATTVKDELRGHQSITQFGATGGADDTTAIANAGSGAYVPPGAYKTSTLTAKTYYGPGQITKLDGSLAPNFAKLGNIGSDGNKDVRQVYGVIRQATSGGGWAFIEDAGHSRNGLESVSVAAGKLVVSYRFTATKVGTFSIVNDETFAALGIQSGASVGDATATISLYKNLDCAVNLQTLAVTPSTYFTGRVSAAAGTNTVVVTHPSCGSATVVPWIVNAATGYENRIISYTSTTVTIGTFVQFCGEIWYDGANWQVATPAAAKPSVAFNGGTGTITVTHETLPTAYARPSVGDACSGALLASRFGTATTTTFTVNVRDLAAAGAVSLTPNTNWRFTYSAPYDVLAETPLGSCSIGRPNCLLDAADVYSGSGNFWLSGEMNI